MEIVSFTINLEHIGDIIDKNLCELAAKKIKRRYQFSAEGAAELTAFHKRVVESLQIGVRHIHDRRCRGGEEIAARESRAARAELDAADRHFERLREGRPESLETTSLHLDILSDLKRIHSHICSVAYPVLEAAGELPARDSAKSDAAGDADVSAEAAVSSDGAQRAIRCAYRTTTLIRISLRSTGLHFYAAFTFAAPPKAGATSVMKRAISSLT